MSDTAYALTRKGAEERNRGNRDEALKFYREAVEIYRAEGNALRLAHSVRHVADIHQEMGQLDLAEPFYGEALAIYREHPETPVGDLANAIRGFALLRSRQAKLLWTEARDLYSEIGIEAGVEESSSQVARLQGF